MALIVRNAAGNTVFDSNDSLGCLLQIVFDVSTNGQITVPGLSSYGIPFSFALPKDNVNLYRTNNVPRVTFSDDIVSWEYSPSGGINLVVDIFIGVR